MVTKEDVEKAWDDYVAQYAESFGHGDAAKAACDAEAYVAVTAARDKYLKLKREYEDGIKSTED